MSDDKVRLFFYGATTTRPAAWTNVREHPHDDALEGVWRPVADDDAREERIEKLRDEGFAMYAAHGDMTRDRDEWKARAEKAEADRDRAYRIGMKAAEDFANATGRVCAFNAELLRLVEPVVEHAEKWGCSGELLDHVQRLGVLFKKAKADAARIDAETRGAGV